MGVRMVGIYSIENMINAKMYIGQSIDIEKRLAEHTNNLKNNNHPNIHLQRSWNKHGETNFSFKVVEECNQALLNEREVYWISHYDSFNSGFNLTLGGEGSLGRVLSDETKKKISISHMGKSIPYKTRKLISKKLKGRPSHCVRYGEEHHLYGKPMPEETKRKISLGNKGKKRSDEFKKK